MLEFLWRREKKEGERLKLERFTSSSSGPETTECQLSGRGLFWEMPNSMAPGKRWLSGREGREVTGDRSDGGRSSR